MKVNIYLKSGQTITLDHVDDMTTKRNSVDDELTHYEFKYKALPDKAAKLHTLMLGDVAAITTENR